MEANQCDGCKRGLAVKDKIHFEKDGKPYIGCSSSLYEKSHRPSDLEIVQRALEKSKSMIRIYPDGTGTLVSQDAQGRAVFSEFVSVSQALTWAKQTIGVE